MDEEKIQWGESPQLINSNRLDVVVKMKYVENKKKCYELNFINDLYKNYIDSVDNIIDSFEKDGNVPLFDVQYMKKRHMSEESIDYIVNEYVKLKEHGIFVGIIYPSVDWESKEEQISGVLNKYGKIVHIKKAKLNYNALRNLMIQIYEEQSWIGNYKNHYHRVSGKLDECFGKRDTVFFVYESDSLEMVLEVKKKIHDLFGIENYGIHITHTHDEAVVLANIVLNKNTIDFLNYAKPDKYVKVNEKLQEFSNRIKENNLDLDEFVVDSSSVLGVYGMRKSDDIDYYSVSDKHSIIDNEIIESHDYYLKYYEKTKTDLIFNPENYFRYRNIKFIKPSLIKSYKTKRNEEKDRIDVKLLDAILENDSRNCKNYLYKIQYIFYKSKKNIRTNLKRICKRILPRKIYIFLKKDSA